ncbi:hypothetical protein ACFY2Q_23110 [Micromonospora sp. NPDC000316]|uniref:hypothetical protein n=1 Tax=Micromonospora sp. NPDC000316 TaxID=3364216 RepID=UPI00368D5DF3
MAPSPSRLFAEIATAERPAETAVVMRRAVVLGGSVAGLLAARVLSDHADDVLIIERDPSDVDAGPRPGVPQGSQVHALLPAGQVQLERWFPGIADEAFALGAPPPPSALSMNVHRVGDTPGGVRSDEVVRAHSRRR